MLDTIEWLRYNIGEPLRNRELPQIIGSLKERGNEVLYNSNGTLLTPVYELRAGANVETRRTYSTNVLGKS